MVPRSRRLTSHNSATSAAPNSAIARWTFGRAGPVDRSTQVRNDDGVVSETHSAMITREPTHSVGTPGMVMLTDVVSKLTS